ncbi:16S rRNA (cytosine(967)-C(5))-methyltransferase RsmB [Hydrocarboniphaga sp.]|uniref:16S rRNA (cytosine(967)-C(5))-methyltransferase RsmB n=1 Tax=Hydrocarboniphaga sp. TaxID=2033016 RepID=UPI003D14D0E7
MVWPTASTTQAKPLNARALAARAVARVLAGDSLDDAIATARRQIAERDLPLIKSMAYGVLREHAQLRALAAQMLTKSMDREPEIMALIEVGLYQLRRMRIPPHAAVADTVEAVSALERPNLVGLVNALLRRYQRERETLEAALPQDAETTYSAPAWLVEGVRKDWPDSWETILASSNEQAPLVLRVNRRKLTRDAYLDKLRADGLPAQIVDAAPDALILESAVPVDQLPGFAEGEVSVQDASAQLMTELLDLRDGQRLLDACAAPGGKTTHALEHAQIEVLALDIAKARLPRVHENLQRLGLSAEVRIADAGRPNTWWDERAFDRILVDAPCSGTGVIRRHPDIRWLRRPDDIQRMADRQLRLLSALWPLLAPGGIMVYATCSVLAAEGEDVAKRFLMSQPDAKHSPIDASWGEARRHGRRIAPGGGFDGFYYARFTKPPKRDT